MASMIPAPSDGLRSFNRRVCKRRGVIMPMFAILLPVLLLLCAVAVNIAHFRLLKTEMKIATDATAHAAGRAMSITQNADATIAFARNAAGMNYVGATPFSIQDSQVVFGRARRTNGGYGRYDFTEMPLEQVRNSTQRPNAVAIDGSRNSPLLIQAIGDYRSLNLADRSVATQVDRDIALVLDRSGSMLDYRDEDGLNNTLYTLYRQGSISYRDYYNARYYNSFSSEVHTRLTGEMRDYVTDVRGSSTTAPRHSRWHILDQGVNAFLDVLQGTPQEELVTLATFSSSARVDYNLSTHYPPIRSFVRQVYPSGATAIGQGIQESVPEIMNGSAARPFAAKTIVILTDGMNNRNPDPVSVVRDLVSRHNVTIHTVTFSTGADQSSMQAVARMGGGKHYHSDDGNELVEIFRQIANNLPTLLTQ